MAIYWTNPYRKYQHAAALKAGRFHRAARLRKEDIERQQRALRAEILKWKS